MSARRRIVVTVTGVLLLLLLGPVAAQATTPPPVPEVPPSSGAGAAAVEVDEESVVGRSPYPGSPQEEAVLVAEEDTRLLEVRTLGSLSRFNTTQLKAPYRLVTGASYTLVLPERVEPYRIPDLLRLAPQTFVRQPDGAYLLSEHLVVDEGATLLLDAPDPLVIRMASDAGGFVSIVSYSGRIEVTGAPDAPVTITSWDRQAAAPDTDTRDGRAYLRAIGGQVGMRNATLTALGFWSGRTGGLALTGTDRPNAGALDALGEELAVPGPPDGEAPDAPGASPSVRVDRALPVPEFDIDQPAFSYVSASLVDTVTNGNAFGLFVATANGVDIRGSAFDNSLVDGMVLHRFVTNAVVEGTRATGNAGDGMVLSRATTGTVLSEVDASRNTRNGISMSGLPLANGPNATGTSSGDYGNNSVSDSRAEGNGRYGIEVVGGHDIGVRANVLHGNDMAVVVRGGARAVAVADNTITEPTRHGIAVRDGVTAATVSGNTVTGGETAVHVRDSAVEVVRNTLTDASVHGITLVGDVEGSTLQQNTVSGRGPSALDVQRADGVDRREFDNELGGWSDTTPWLVTLKRVLQPLNLLWATLAVIVIVTALRGARRRTGVVHPYADSRPLTTAADVVVPAPAGSR